MALDLKEEAVGKVLVVRVSDKLSTEDYERLVPEVERLIKQHGKIRVLFDMQEFRGWEAGALWEDIKFAYTHFSNIERIAMVGEKKWQEGMTTFCKPFTAATIRYFDQEESEQAHDWLTGE